MTGLTSLSGTCVSHAYDDQPEAPAYVQKAAAAFSCRGHLTPLTSSRGFSFECELPHFWHMSHPSTTTNVGGPAAWPQLVSPRSSCVPVGPSCLGQSDIFSIESGTHWATAAQYLACKSSALLSRAGLGQVYEGRRDIPGPTLTQTL